ncbi:MAG: 16S rRNA (cytosine(1402)-N(4))-methyltransferase RsmH, partial [Pseudomonadales bacterium]|nr:16S rRNA (cytosine(1402)-N(4))-methyltransferase RsmH [Pseudomonadales bacterium]
MTANSLHESVLMQEAVAALRIHAGKTFIDATFGRGGHSRLILESLGPQGRLLALDRDPDAIVAAQKLRQQDHRLEVIHQPFSELGEITRNRGLFGEVDGILFDLGVSSPQLDDSSRGFSFLRDGPLDMRMDPGQGISAAQWIKTADEKAIADVIYRFGEERHSRRMARRIVLERAEREITTTGQLAEIIKQANPAWEKSKHPATRAFQGIRIFINSEFDELEKGLDQTLDLLTIGGRLVVISFHSLEDRIVKKFIALQTTGDSYPRDLPVPQEMLNPRLRSIGKASKASVSEINRNPR